MGTSGEQGEAVSDPPDMCPPTPSQIRRHSTNPCLKCAFQNTRSQSPSGCRHPSWGPGWSQQQVRDRPPRHFWRPLGRGSTSRGHCWGPRPKGMGRGGPPWRSLGAGHCDHTAGGSPVPRRPLWGRSTFYPHPFPSLFPRITSLWMLPPPSQWALTFILKLSIYLCSHLEMSVH